MMPNTNAQATEDLDAQIAFAMIEYKDRIAEIVEDTYAEQLGPVFADALARTMFEIFKSGLMLGLGHSADPGAKTVLLSYTTPLGTA
ncbi:MAG TPA: hypothetical protein VKY65_06985 [Alphaproteobacteria bacterium]|nr:hypothetical protein [Alphaproteobacteria bacterium]